jgi:hypothetical protein
VTATSLITDALMELGVLGTNEALSGNDLALCLRRLQALVDAWRLDELTMPTVVRTTVDLVSSTAAYTIGTGATINIARPQFINSAAYIPDPSASTPVEIPLEVLSDQRYAQWPLKTLTAAYPQAIYYNHGFTSSGYGTITVLPTPSSATPDLVLYCPTAMVGFVDATTVYTFPPGYEDAFLYGLALRLAPAFTRPITPELKEAAYQSLRRIKEANLRPWELSMDPVLVGGVASNIYTGAA